MFNGEIVVRERGGRRSAQTTWSMNFGVVEGLRRRHGAR